MSNKMNTDKTLLCSRCCQTTWRPCWPWFLRVKPVISICSRLPDWLPYSTVPRTPSTCPPCKYTDIHMHIHRHTVHFLTNRHTTKHNLTHNHMLKYTKTHNNIQCCLQCYNVASGLFFCVCVFLAVKCRSLSRHRSMVNRAHSHGWTWQLNTCSRCSP